MAHCSTALIRCMDFRLGSAIRDYMQSNGLYDDTDVISIAGAAKDLNDQSMGDAVAGQIGLSAKLHSINTIILMNHTDCGGYGGRSAFEGVDAEREHHLKELNAAKEKLTGEYPDVTIRLALADIRDDGSVNIEDIS